MRIKTALIGAAAALVAAVTPATGANAQSSFSFSISSGDYYGYDRPYGYHDYGYPRYVYAYPSRYYRYDRNRHWDRGRHNGWRDDRGRHNRRGWR